jgi:hypothetical protein
MAIAKIAYGQLSDGQKNKIAEILKKHPHYKEFLIKQKPASVPEHEWVFLRAATWPDWVKVPKNKATKFSVPERHYINMPFVKDEGEETIRKETLPIRGKILVGLQEQMKILGNPDEDAGKRAVALCWVLHLCGDIHQPLHCAAMFSTRFPEGDKGGNMQQVSVNGHAVKLHAYWDGLIGLSQKYGLIEASALGIARDPKHTRSVLKAELARGEFADWAKESYELARVFAYLEGDLKSRKLQEDHDVEEEEFFVPPVPPNYAERARVVARKQAALGGYRLHDKLASIFE